MQNKEESSLLLTKHILLCLEDELGAIFSLRLARELDYLKQNFCGLVFSSMQEFNEYKCEDDTLIYFCGNIAKHPELLKGGVFAVDKLSITYTIKDEGKEEIDCQRVTIEEVPLNIHNVGVFFPKFFHSETNYFDAVSAAHKFQTLTESNKPSNAFRSGIYLTPVGASQIKNVEEVKFNLLRCSSNLGGPTENFRAVDHEIMEKVNQISKRFFASSAELNHVLAQIYENRIDESKDVGRVGKSKRAKIKAHSDKTKDMPRNGLIAFCTFYREEEKTIKPAALTKLRFKLKDGLELVGYKLEKKFDVLLYPNSVFIISLFTNRLYTHEIVPSSLPIDKIPTRLGYVIRCSKTRAVFKEGQTYIVDDTKEQKEGKNEPVLLKEADPENIKQLKTLYYQENTGYELVNYPPVHFSLNQGDYLKPVV